MYFEIDYEGKPAGFAVEDASGGEDVQLRIMGFLSSEDGAEFLKALEGIPSTVLNQIPIESRILESQVDNMLVLFPNNGKALVYLNEVIPLALARAKTNIAAGEVVTANKLSDVKRVELPDRIDIKNDYGILYLFSLGWRKGLFYDFNPTHGNNRDYDLGELLGAFFSYLIFQNVFNITEEQWNNIIENGWFPFVLLDQSTVDEIIWCARNNRNYDKLEDLIHKDAVAKLSSRVESWSRNPGLSEHHECLSQAFSHYLVSDFLSANSLIYPRIEGILRSFFRTQGLSGRQSQDTLSDALLDEFDNKSHGYSILLPKYFKRFLLENYYRNFDNRNPSGVSRHTVSHGVAPVREMKQRKSALIGLLLVDQLSFYLGSEEIANARDNLSGSKSDQ